MRIVEWKPHHAKLLADLWNASDSGWLSGLVHGRPKTPAQALEWERMTDALARFLALDGPRPIGYVRLNEWWESRDATYVQWLNVDPSHHGKGVGRELLRRSIDRTFDLGYPRIDLHTWPGNEKAMPLYKRSGFMWVPGSHAYLQNYVPLLRRYGPARPFFARHDWYASLVRDLDRDHDRETVRGRDAFVYRFRAGRDRLEATIDREARDVMAFEDPSIRAESWIPEGTLLEGKPGEIRWSVRNGSGEGISVRIAARAPRGVRVAAPSSFRLRARETREVRASVTLPRGFRDTPSGWACPSIASVVSAGTKEIRLAAGFRPKAPLSVEWDEPRPLAPSKDGDLVAVLRNPGGRSFRGTVAFSGEGVRFRPDRVRVHVPSGGMRRIPVAVEDRRGTVRATVARIRFGGTAIRITKELPVLFLSPGRGISYRKGTDLVLESSRVRMTSADRGGYASFALPDGTRLLRGVVLFPGPPYWPSDSEQGRWKGRIEWDDGPCLIRTLASRARPGLVLEQRWRMLGDRVVESRFAVENRGPKAWTVGLAVACEGLGDHAAVTLPTAHGAVTEAMMDGEWPDVREDVPLDDLLTEDWIHGRIEGAGLGVVWAPEGPLAKRELTSWLSPSWYTRPARVPPGGRHAFPRSWFVATPDWKEVRRVWSDLSGRLVSELPERTGTPFLEAEPGLVLASPAARVRIRIENLRRRSVTGTLSIDPGRGLGVDARSVLVRDVRLGRPASRDLRVSGRGPCASSLRFRLETPRGRREWDVPAIATDGPSGLRIRTSADRAVLENGRLHLAGSAAHGASLVSLRTAGHEFLVTSHPTPRSFAWFRPWYGGLSPYVYAEDWPGDLYREGFRSSTARRGTWRGVRFSAHTGRSDLPKGLGVEVEYLTRPGSPLVAAALTLRNRTEERRSLTAGFWAFLGLDGKPSDEVEFARLVPRHWRPAAWTAWSLADDGWATFRAPRSSRSVAVSAASPALLEVFDVRGFGRHGTIVQNVRLAPKQAVTILGTVAVLPPGETSSYRVLRHLSAASFEATRPR